MTHIIIIKNVDISGITMLRVFSVIIMPTQLIITSHHCSSY